MIRIPRNTRLMNFLRLQISVRTGLIRNWPLTLKNVTARKSVPSNVSPNAASPKAVPVPVVRLQNHIFTRTTVPKDSFPAKSVTRNSPSRIKLFFHQFDDKFRFNITQVIRLINDNEGSSILKNADNMPGKWQLLIFLGQQTILQVQKSQAGGEVCSWIQSRR